MRKRNLRKTTRERIVTKPHKNVFVSNFSDISNSILCKLLNNSSTCNIFSIKIWNFDEFFQLFHDEFTDDFKSDKNLSPIYFYCLKSINCDFLWWFNFIATFSWNVLHHHEIYYDADNILRHRKAFHCSININWAISALIR